MSIDSRAEREREEARQARCVENHCEIHAPLNPEWPLVKCARVWAETGRGRKSVGAPLPCSHITHQTPDTLLQMRENLKLNDYKVSGARVSDCHSSAGWC